MARVSVDTLSMAIWFGGEGARLGGMPVVLGLALVFGAGMIVADGVCGWWVSRLNAAGERARGQWFAGWLIGLGALATAGLGAARQFSPALDDWAKAHSLTLGLSLFGVTSAALLAVVLLSRSRRG